MRKFIINTKPQLLAWTPEGNVESHRSFPKIGGEKLDWKVVMEVPAKFEKDFMGLWELWLLVEELAPTKGRNWTWVTYSRAEWETAFSNIVSLMSGAGRDAARLRRTTIVPSIEGLEIVDSQTATYSLMLKAAVAIGTRRKLVTMLRNRLLVLTLEQAKASGRTRTRNIGNAQSKRCVK